MPRSPANPVRHRACCVYGPQAHRGCSSPELQYAARHDPCLNARSNGIDLVGYQHHAGGLDQVATILSELVEKIDPGKLAAAAQTAPIPWAQRLGYLLERIGASKKASALKNYVQERARLATVLLPTAPRGDAHRDDDWNLYVNADVEAEA